MASTRISTAFSGTTDANGNATITVPSSPTQYTVLTVVGQIAGTIATLAGSAAKWTIQVNGQAIDFGVGNNVTLGPFICHPNEPVTILVNHASPSFAISGTLVGTAYDTIDGATAAYVPSPSNINVLAASQAFLVELDAGLNATTTKTVNIPSGTASLLLTVGETPPPGTFVSALPSQVIVTGTQTGIVYLNVSGAAVQTVMPVLVSSRDQQVTVQNIGPTSGSNLQIAVVGVEAIPASLNFDVIDRVARLLGHVTVDSLPGIPRLWQAPTKLKYLEGTTSETGRQLVTGIVNQTIYIFGWEITCDGCASSNFVSLFDDSLTSLTGRFATFWNLATNPGTLSVTGYYGGLPLTIGAGVQLTSSQACGWRVSLSYSQG